LGDAPAWNPRVVCVLGMHRNGTSLIARILYSSAYSWALIGTS
jgi:hypothetical protein